MLWLSRQLTEEDKDELLHEPLGCYPTAFPRDSLLLADPGTWALWLCLCVCSGRCGWVGL